MKRLHLKHLGKNSSVRLWGNGPLVVGHSKTESYPEGKKGGIYTACIKLYWFLICFHLQFKHKGLIEKKTYFRLSISKRSELFALEIFGGYIPSLTIEFLTRNNWPITYWPYGLEDYRPKKRSNVI